MQGMLFWIIIAALALCVTTLLALAMRRGAQHTPASDFDLRVYRDQLSEVDRDLARGVIAQGDADRVRTEISRRILAADASAQAPAHGRADTKGGVAGIAALALFLVLGSGTLYWQLGALGYGDLALADRIAASETFRESRPTQADAENSLSAEDFPPVTQADDAYLDLVAKLRDVTVARPDDAEGFRLLAVSEANLGNFSAAHTAQARVIEIAADTAQSQAYTRHANLMILAAGGYVSPEAEAALRRALDLNPSDGTALYYWGLMLEQTGRPDQTLRIWDSLLRRGPADAAWIPPVQAQIAEIALRAGVSYAMPNPGTGRGPTEADIAAAGDVSAADRMEMIEGMVDGLSDRLATEGGTVDEWAQLITALGVLGRIQQADAVFSEAAELFGGDPSAMDHLNRAGERAGVVE